MASQRFKEGYKELSCVLVGCTAWLVQSGPMCGGTASQSRVLVQGNRFVALVEDALLSHGLNSNMGWQHCQARSTWPMLHGEVSS
jgi:hypothetical protein